MKIKGSKDQKNILVLGVVYLLLVAILVHGKYLYGSTIDWQNQSWEFAEYFRKLFYKTGQLIPNFALHLGGGENIYYFSYYGLFSPVILVSYLLPFIKMMDYIMITNILTVFLSVVLFYVWLRKKHYNSKISFMGSFLFLCASPLIYHSHKQMMFMNYVPFLILSLIGIDLYFEKKKSKLLIIALFFMIMTSYYFSVAGLFVVCIYTIHIFLQQKKCFHIKEMFAVSMTIAVRIIVAISMAALLLLPTLYALKNGRKSSGIMHVSLLFPKIALDNLLYSPYSPGVTAIVIFAIIYAIFCRKKEFVFLSATSLIFFSFPIFNYILNGTLYLNAKVFIPFLPLLLILVVEFLSAMEEKSLSKLDFIKIIVFTGIIFLWNIKWEFDVLYLFEVCVILVLLYISNKTRKRNVLYGFLILTSLVICIVVNKSDLLVKDSDEDTNYSVKNSTMIDDVYKSDKQFYRISNDYFPIMNLNKIYNQSYYQTSIYSSSNNSMYATIFFDVFNNDMAYRNERIIGSTDNILFNTYMGNKYIITNHAPPVGYTLVNSDKNVSIYENKNVFPLGFVSNQLLSKDSYDKLVYPYNAEALLHYAVVDEKINTKPVSSIKKLSLDQSIDSYSAHNVKMKSQAGKYEVDAKQNATMKMKLNPEISNKIILVHFHMDYQDVNQDLGITINGVSNKLTCSSWQYQNNNKDFDYVISSNHPIKDLNIQFLKGHYELTNIQLYALDYDSFSNQNTKLDSFVVNMDKTKGDDIVGNIAVTKAGYFVLNIPYDKGFTILVNGKEIKYEKVNGGFIGFPMDKGKYNIKIKFQAPLSDIGKYISIIGVVLWLLILFIERRKNKFLEEDT